MILCANCGVIKLYAKRKMTTKLQLFDEKGRLKEETPETVRYGKVKCPHCGRIVKFFTDMEDDNA